MNTAPITSWEGAEAYFTFADKPGVLAVLIIAGVAVCAFTIFSMAKHETSSYKKY